MFAEICAKRGNSLERGEIITTGTLTPPLDGRAGDRYAAKAEGGVLPSVSVSLV